MPARLASASENLSSDDSLHFIVTGAGIAGLTTAYILKHAGHRVTVLEKYPRDIQKDGGLRIPPNMTRLLCEFPGAKSLLESKASRCAGCDYKGDHLDSIAGKMVFIKELMTDLGCEFYMIPYADLHGYLYDLCLDAGLQVRHGFDVEQVLVSEGSPPSVVSKTGECITADIVIGADGKNSVVRQVLLDENQDTEREPTDTKKSTFPPMKDIAGASISIPLSLMKADPELSPFAEEEYLSTLMGDGVRVIGTRYGPGLYVLGLNITYLPPNDVDMDWHSGQPVATVLQHTEEYDDRLKKLLGKASTSHWSTQRVYNFSRYSSKYNQVILIGDAAHSVPINSTQNTAAAFEDAFTLGRLFSHRTSRSRAKHALVLHGYNQIRRKRTRTLELSDMDAVQLMGMPPGPERDGRDNALSLTLNLEGADDETLASVWSSYVAQFNYDAREAVDEWWMNWARPASISSESSSVRTVDKA